MKEENKLIFRKCKLNDDDNQFISPNSIKFSKIKAPIRIKTQSFKNQRYINSKSVFVKYGVVFDHLKKEEMDKQYPLKNFKTVKKGRDTHILGFDKNGRVFLTQNIKDQKYYSVKEISKEKLMENNDERFIRNELKILPKLNHEHIIRLYNYFENDDSFLSILEYAAKGSLYDLLKSNNFVGMSEKQAFTYFIQVASAVQFLHENKLVHRDIKPENILIDESEIVKLSNFGWCVELTCGNRDSFCGTYEYMAPEIIKEIPYNFSVDMWALGILLYELLHGYSPFRANSTQDEYYLEVFKNITKNDIQFEKDLSDNCIDLLKSKLISKLELLCKNQNERIKIKDLFSHPWVIHHEKDYTDLKLRNSESTNYNSNSSLNSNFLTKEDSNIFNSVSKSLVFPNQEDQIINNNYLDTEDSSALFDKVLNKLTKKNISNFF